MIKFLDLPQQYQKIKTEMDAAIANVISKSAFIGGEEIRGFEKCFANFHNSENCIAVANGTDALEIAIEALNLPKNSDIIVPANSFIASSEAVTRSGHNVVFCDCDPENYTINVKNLKSVLTSKTRAIIAVHLYGHPCAMDEIMKLAQERNVKVIEDCAQSHIAEYKDEKVGAIGDIGTFSFYPGKNLGAYGDGGAILTNKDELAKKCRMIANHGRIEKYNHEFEGRNSRLDNLQAAVLNVKLKYLEEWTNHRISIANYYLDALKELDEIILPKREKWAKQVYHLFVIRTERRSELQKHLSENGVQTGIHYPIALPKLKAYQYLGEVNYEFNANQYDSQLLSLPIGEHLSLDEAEQVVSAVKSFFRAR